MWEEAGQPVLKAVAKAIKKWHPHLQQARIGLLFRETSSKSQGKEIVGKALKVSERDQQFMDLDFIVWFAKDHWQTLSPEAKIALVDHELSHCYYEDPTDPTTAKVHAHDFEGFVSVINRHGFWNLDLHQMGETAQQLELPSLERGELVALKPSEMERVAA